MLRKTGWVVAALAAASPALAQERVDEADLPRSVADEVIEFFNRPATIRFRGQGEVPAGRVIQGDVAVLRGPFLVAGEIEGDLIVVNGDLQIASGGMITGDVMVIGGEVIADPGAVGGQLTVYDEPLSYGSRGERITYRERPWAGWSRHDRGRAYISVRSDGNYNRVEGLPVLFGPVFRSRGDDFFRADVMGIWRSDSGLRLHTEEMGYFIRAEQHLGPDGRLSAGGTFHSLIAPIEDGGLSDAEASLATFLLRRDYRDYYGREGFSAFLRYADEDAGVRLTAEYRDEDHAFAPVGDPWTLKDDGDRAWRPQPLIGVGRLRTLGGQLLVDDRNDRDDPSDGWYLAAAGTAGIDGDLELPQYRLAEPAPPSIAAPARSLDMDFVAGSVDLRRYVRLGPSSDFRLRGFLAGSVDGKPLPPQFQRTLGGEGSLPGYPLMTVDCGARARAYSVFLGEGEDAVRAPTFAGYGCDRVALFQAEFRGSISFDPDVGGEDDWDEGWGWSPATSFDPSWSLFFDAGRGWTLSDVGTPGRLGPDTDSLMDVGVGFFLGDLGIYWAWPLTGDDRKANFFVRMTHRF